ncbi:hypothetical protein D3C86_1990590 [compost metagenome]
MSVGQFIKQHSGASVILWPLDAVHELTAQLLQKHLKIFERGAHALRIFKNSGHGFVPLLLLAYHAVAVS